MNLWYKNKYVLIMIIILFTIICGIVYYFIQNNEENAYVDLNNDFINNTLIDNETKIEIIKTIKIHISGEVISPRSY